MAFSLNKVMLIGNVGRDPEYRFTTTSNVEIAKFSMATTYSRKNRDGQWEDETTWHNIVAFSLSDFYKQSLRKGAKLYVEGRINTREYEKDGQKRYFTEIVSEKIIPLEGRGGGGSDSSYSQEPSSSQHSGQEPSMPDNPDDDLPF